MNTSTIERKKQPTDQQRESAIKAELEQVTQARNANDLVSAGAHWRKAVELIQGRSPEQVKQMETEKGLT